MKSKGSITIYICLTMIVVLSLIATGLRSTVVASARVSMVSSVDLGLYSLFGQYDRDFFEEYGLLFIDGGYKHSDLKMGKVYQELKEDIEYNLFSESFANGWYPRVVGGSVQGYSLATDGAGSVFKEQVVSYMQETIGAQGIVALMDKVASESAMLQQQESDKGQIDSGDIEDYEEIKRQQAEAEAEALAQAQADGVELEIPPPEVDPDFQNPIEAMQILQKLGTLNLLIPDTDNISGKSISMGEYASQRELQQGLGVIPSNSEAQGVVANFLFQEYMIGKSGSYLSPQTSAALDYQLEYFLLGKDSDLENLKGVANRLLLTREAANFLHIFTDSTKRAQVSSMALIIASAIGVPAAAQAVEGVLMLMWAFGESVVDVRALFRGEKVPLVKNSTTWQVSLDNLANLPELMNGELGEQEHGLDYKGYLRILLSLKSDEEKVARAMDIVEMTMRGKSGRENFKLDSCLYSLDIDVKMSVLTNTYDVQRSYGYDM